MRSTGAGRWSLAVLVVVVALIVAIWPRDTETPDPGGSGMPTGTAAPVDRRAQDDAQALAPLRAEANLQPCPAPTGAEPAGPLTGMTFECVGDGSAVDLAAALAGRPAILNLWAWWCGPCAEELPVLQEYARRAGDRVALVTVHTDPNEANALSRLVEYGVQLPGVQDGSARVQAAAAAPPVLPLTVLVRPDGSIAKVLPQPFRSVEEIAAAVETHLGVSA
ncbi:TlpA family protein disulfide reductase [Rhodococcus sp. NPDC003383]